MTTNYREAILQALEIPSTQTNLATRVGTSIATVCGWLGVLMAKHEAHISEWISQPRGGKPVAIYKAGAGQNAERPQPSINATRSRASRAYARRFH